MRYLIATVYQSAKAPIFMVWGSYKRHGQEYKSHFKVSTLLEAYRIAPLPMELGGMPIDVGMYIKYNLSKYIFSCVYRIFFVIFVDWISLKELSKTA